MPYLTAIIAILILLSAPVKAQQGSIVISGTVNDEITKAGLEGVVLKFDDGRFSALTNASGFFSIRVPARQVLHLTCIRTGYKPLTRELKTGFKDSLALQIDMSINYRQLDTVAVGVVQKPETLVGKPDYSVFDFDFFEDRLLLLTSSSTLKNAEVKLSDFKGKIYSTFYVPQSAGDAKFFYRDFEGYTDLVCADSVFRLDVLGDEILPMGINKTDYDNFLSRVSDTANGNLYYSNRWDKYPSFNYYYLKRNDTVNHLLGRVSNEDLLKMYNMEYYFLPSRMQLEARRMADYYKTDVHIIAAMMSGFTSSMFYEPLYAPLFIIRDTICIFNHHNDYLYHYSRQNRLIDSVKIDYHHPKNWREWKKKLFVDETEDNVYAFFSKNGHHYLKRINYQSGQTRLTYKLKHHSAERIKIRQGYVYYVYRPFGSTQERFLYRERIE